MKKLLSVLLAVLMISGFAVTAFADAGGPVFREYSATVSNPDGAKDVDDNRVIPYQAKVTVTSEYQAYKSNEIHSFVEYKDDVYCVNSSDLAKTESKVGIDAAVKLPKMLERVVLAEDGVELHDGPSESYDVVATIPYGTEIKSQYASSESFIGWMYVSYKNYNGWVYIYPDNTDVVRVNNNSKTNFVEIIDSGHYIFDNETSKNLVEVPVGTKLNYKYYDGSMGNVYVEYNGQKGWLRVFGIGDKDEGFNAVKGVDYGAYVKTGELELFEKPCTPDDEAVPQTVTTVPAEEYLYVTKSTHYYSDDLSDDWYYAQYNGKSGWFKADSAYDENKPVSVFESEISMTVNGDVKVYSEPDDTSSLIGTLSAGAKQLAARDRFSDYILVQCNGQYGWINTNNENNIEYFYLDSFDMDFSLFMPDESQVEPAPVNTENNEETSAAPELINKKKKAEKQDEQESFFTPQRIIALSVVAACVVAAAAAIIIIIRKKNK